MSVLIGNLVGFVIIVAVLVKFVVPPVRTMMKNQQDAILAAIEESKAAAAKLANADQTHAKALADAKSEAAKVTEEARADSTRITEQLAEQAVVEAERLKAQGGQQVHLLRQQTIRDLRGTLGSESVAKAEQIVRTYVADPAQQSATVDRFLDELDQMSPSTAAVETGAALNLRAASRDALAATVTKFDEVAGGLDSAGQAALADDLTSVAKLLIAEPVLARHLADSSDNVAPKTQLVESLLAGKIGAPALTIVQTVAAQRWSVESNLVDAVEHTARLARLVQAEQAGEGEAVEEQLFQFGRALDSSPQLITLLSDYSTAADSRVALLNKVLSGTGDVNPTVSALLAQTVSLVRGERVDEAVADLAELAVARRGEVVAHVTAAANLTDAQRTRLTEILGRIYNHPIAVQLNIDPAVLGGLQISVADEVIDGAIASRLTAARAGLPD